jgi:hypothetical protein
VHFVVDVHQPLHVGRAADRGGNAIEILVDRRPTNLHQLWDSGLLARDPRPIGEVTVALVALAGANVRAWSGGRIADWALESLKLREFVYSFDGQPDAAYLAAAELAFRRRLTQAGLRLGGVLNAMFCSR